MLLSEIKLGVVNDTDADVIKLLERDEQSPVGQIKNQLSQRIPAFPGTQLKKEIDELIKNSASLIKDFAERAKPFAQQRGYRVEIFDTMLKNPEKVAKMLIKKYASSYKDDALAFRLRDVLKDVNLDLDQN
jgi:hypothetical protein